MSRSKRLKSCEKICVEQRFTYYPRKGTVIYYNIVKFTTRKNDFFVDYESYGRKQREHNYYLHHVVLSQLGGYLAVIQNF